MKSATTKEAQMLFSPANQLLFEVRQLAAEIHGTPAWGHFPRWWRKGQSMWLESSAGSRTLTVDFDLGKVTLPAWAGGTVQDMPAHWADLYLGSLFDSNGDALHRDKFDAAMAQTGWKGNL